MEKFNPNQQNIASGFGVLHEWLRAKWGLESPKTRPGAWIKVVELGCGQCMVNKSMTSAPLTIGQTRFARGLGVHANSEIQVVLPSSGKSFHACIGRDENSITNGESANLYFRVDGEGRELYESPLIKGGEEPLPIEVNLDGASEITLRVGDTFDWGHADWAEARVILKNGQTVWLDELPFDGAVPECSPTPPFSFRNKGATFESQFASWQTSTLTEELDDNRSRHIVIYRNPGSDLEIRCEIVVFTDFSAVEWVLHFTNTGTTRLGPIDEIRSLDMHLSRSLWAREFVLHHAVGSVCAERDFAPLEQVLLPNSDFHLAPENGRSSSGTMPFFNLESSGGGVIGAVGWSGQWQASFERDDKAGVRVHAGIESACVELSPGESIRTPSTLLLFWKGDRIRSHNMWRALMLQHYSPRPSGLPVQLPISFLTWGMFAEGELIRRNEVLDNTKAAIDTFWVDAGWYGECQQMGDWYKQAGNWQPNSTLFPRGLKPVADAVHASNRKFLLWFDCERVYRDSDLFRAHPEWLLELEAESQTGYEGFNENFLFNLGCAEARRFMTETISNIISEVGVDIVRQDFNVEPLRFWRKRDSSNRQGMTEIRYIEGLYAFWDELVARHPHILIDNCASGGRRLDIELAKRSVPLWRSDLQCCPDYSALGTQSQTFGLASWLPLSCAGTREYGDTYDFRSALGSGTVGYWAPKLVSEDEAWARARLAESHLVRPYFHGDFYPLTSYSLSTDVWLVFQLDRGDLGGGVIMAFRRENAPYPTATVQLKALDHDSHYELTDSDTGRTEIQAGSDLSELGFSIHMPTPRSSALITYQKMAA